MKFVKTKIPEVVIIEPAVFTDERGYFLESFNKEEFTANIGEVNFIQDNESKSSKGVLRGLHFQRPPFAQAKLVRCIEGVVIDVAVDIRKGSPTFGQHVAVALSGENKKQLFVPRGFAHVFSVISDFAIYAYKVDNTFAPEYDQGLLWSDKDLAIDWKLKTEEILVSEKDKHLKTLKESNIPFVYNKFK